MAAYVVMIREEMTDAEAFQEYAKLAPKASAGHEVTPRAFYGRHEVVEGPDCEGVVVLEFPDFDQAKAWYESPQYQEAAQLRFKGARYRVMIADGV